MATRRSEFDAPDISPEEMFNMFFGTGRPRFNSKFYQPHEGFRRPSPQPQVHVSKEPTISWVLNKYWQFSSMPGVDSLHPFLRTAVCTVALSGIALAIAPFGTVYHAYCLAHHGIRLWKDRSLWKNPQEVQKLDEYAAAFFMDGLFLGFAVFLGGSAFHAVVKPTEASISLLAFSFVPFFLFADILSNQKPKMPEPEEPAHRAEPNDQSTSHASAPESEAKPALGNSWDEIIERDSATLKKDKQSHIVHPNKSYEAFYQGVLKKQSPHELFGFSANETPSEKDIKSKFNALANCIYPDKNADRKREAEILFNCLREATNTLLKMVRN